ncbi:hypothetical protein CPB83DRAFT_910731 [Crepidotus variabilis]|uniref:HTH CENPB-type domain-containing protein n=1 Tax=Crepidotus variabilis TaxID=179855 RepID=A0A9P6JJV9_9AGAR|nr:hypothetical protein CPB83DRAFT_910731 [Crepidotus variabilis]
MASRPFPSSKGKVHDDNRVAICEYIALRTNMTQEEVAKHFGLARSTISKIINDGERWSKRKCNPFQKKQQYRQRLPKCPLLELGMMKHLQMWNKNLVHISDKHIRDEASGIALRLGLTLEEFRPSKNWLEGFKRRHGIRCGQWQRKKELSWRDLPRYHLIPRAPEVAPPSVTQPTANGDFVHHRATRHVLDPSEDPIFSVFLPSPALPSHAPNAINIRELSDEELFALLEGRFVARCYD